tara:strand:- start:5793 stop:6470 length:678 start_codon:yes stop_codon:yes gene_type:complete
MTDIITLYGHLTVDKIIVDFQEQVSLGGIANVWHGIKYLNKNVSVNLVPTNIGEAVVLVDKDSNQRIGRGCLNLSSSKVKHKKSDWHHIAYLNQVTHTNFIKEISQGIISADITKEYPEKAIPLLSHIDYLFISEDDLFMDLKELGNLTKGWVIMHSPKRSICTDGNQELSYEIPKNLMLNGVNVLGAGDYFASAFITQTIKGLELKDAITHAHKNTTEILKNQT